MCGRFTQKQKAAIIEKMYGIDKVVAEIAAIFNNMRSFTGRFAEIGFYISSRRRLVDISPSK